MYKQTERLKKQLVELTDAVNAFRSEAVQVIVVDHILDHLYIDDPDKSDSDIFVPKTGIFLNLQDKTVPQIKEKKIGLTIILRQLLGSDFFDTPKSISDITDFCAEKFDVAAYTYQVSGILLGLIKQNKLTRIKSDQTNRYIYLKPTG